MNASNFSWNFLLPIGIVAFSLLLGVLLQRWISSNLQKKAQRTAAKWDDILIKALRGVFILWFCLLGVAIAQKTINFPPDTENIIKKAVTLMAIFSGVIFSVRLAAGFLHLYVNKLTGIPATLLRNITAIIIYFIGFMIVLDYLGISITPIITALGLGGLAVALALQDTLSNLFSGINILMTKKIMPGDYIRTDSGYEGYVVDITWRNTTIRALPNNLIIIPNSKLASSVITNFHLPEKEMAVLVDVGVSYESDLEMVEKVIVDVAQEIMREIPGGIPEFSPFVRFHTFADHSINGTVILRGKEFVDQFRIKHEFVKKLHERFKRESIVIPYPIRTVYLEKKEG